MGLVLRYFFFNPFLVDGPSMEPNFHNKEYMFITRVTYYYSPPQRGDVVIFHPVQSPREAWIKRIIGLPQEEIAIKEGKVYIDGQLLQEPYVANEVKTTVENQENVLQRKLKADEYFLMGDNRESSYDSREIGPVPKINIVGKPWVVLFPLSDIRLPQQGKPVLVTSQ